VKVYELMALYELKQRAYKENGYLSAIKISDDTVDIQMNRKGFDEMFKTSQIVKTDEDRYERFFTIGDFRFFTLLYGCELTEEDKAELKF